MPMKKKTAVQLTILAIVAGVIVIVALFANRGIDLVGLLKKLHGG